MFNMVIIKKGKEKQHHLLGDKLENQINIDLS